MLTLKVIINVYKYRKRLPRPGAARHRSTPGLATGRRGAVHAGVLGALSRYGGSHGVSTLNSVLRKPRLRVHADRLRITRIANGLSHGAAVPASLTRTIVSASDK